MRVDFDRRLRFELHGSKITSDTGLRAYRELNEVLGLTDLGGAALSDLRRDKNSRHLLSGLLHESGGDRGGRLEEFRPEDVYGDP